MSNMLHANGVPHFQLPKSFTSDPERCRRWKGGAYALYVHLCYLAQEQSKVSIFLSATDLREKLGMAGDTVLTARGALEAEGFIRFTRTSGGYHYQLLQPDTGKPLVKGMTGDRAPFDLDDIQPEDLEKYFRQHTEGPVKVRGNKLRLCCPVHPDSTPSLEVDLSKHGLWFCHPCDKGGKLVAFEQWIAKGNGEDISTEDARSRIGRVLASLGVKEADLGQPESKYAYHVADGRLLFEVLRYKGKVFKQRRPDPDKPGKFIWNLNGVDTVLYRLSEIADADVVIIVEGEKDADNLRSLNLRSNAIGLNDAVAVTTCPGGAGKWQASYSEALRGKRVVILPDNDGAGHRHGQFVAEALKGIASEVHLREFPNGFKDATDYLEEHDRGEMETFIGSHLIAIPDWDDI